MYYVVDWWWASFRPHSATQVLFKCLNLPVPLLKSLATPTWTLKTLLLTCPLFPSTPCLIFMPRNCPSLVPALSTPDLMKANIGIGWKKVVFTFSNNQRLCSLQAFYDNQAMSLFGSENLEAELVVIDLQPEEYMSAYLVCNVLDIVSNSLSCINRIHLRID